MAIDLEQLFNSEKSLPYVPEFKPRGDVWFGFACPLEIDNVIVEGLQMRGSAMRTLPDEAVCLQLEYHPPRGSIRGGAFARIEWRPIKAHNNKGRGPKEWRFKEIASSHNHSFTINWAEAASRVRRGELPIAIPVNDDLPDFDSFLVFVKKEFRISNLEWLLPPEWSATLF